MRGVMSKKGYITLSRSEKTLWLLSKHPNAFLLLTLISLRANRYIDSPDGYFIGECHIGDYKECGLSEKEYRTAKKVLEIGGFILIVETCRTRKSSRDVKQTFNSGNLENRASTRTTYGTKVKLINSEVYDINSEDHGDRKGDRGATEGRPRGDEQEYNNCKPEEQQQPQTPKGTCVVFSCLEKIDDPSIGQKQKERITRNHEGNEQLVIDAVAAILQPSFKPETTLLKALNAAIKGAWKPLPEKEDSIKLNKKKALELQMKGHQYYKIEACSSYLEIIAGPISHIVQYELSSDKFDKQVQEHLKIGKQA